MKDALRQQCFAARVLLSASFAFKRLALRLAEPRDGDLFHAGLSRQPAAQSASGRNAGWR